LAAIKQMLPRSGETPEERLTKFADLHLVLQLAQDGVDPQTLTAQEMDDRRNRMREYLRFVWAGRKPRPESHA
jgi:hypothetical protein